MHVGMFSKHRQTQYFMWLAVLFIVTGYYTVGTATFMTQNVGMSYAIVWFCSVGNTLDTRVYYYSLFTYRLCLSRITKTTNIPSLQTTENSIALSVLQFSQHGQHCKRWHIKQVCVQLLRTLTTWHCPHSSAAAAAVDRYHLPAGPTAANLQQPGLLLWTHAGTDRRTDTVPFDRPCSAYYARSANNQQDSRCLFIYLNISGKGCKPLICR